MGLGPTASPFVAPKCRWEISRHTTFNGARVRAASYDPWNWTVTRLRSARIKELDSSQVTVWSKRRDQRRGNSNANDFFEKQATGRPVDESWPTIRAQGGASKTDCARSYASEEIFGTAGEIRFRDHRGRASCVSSQFDSFGIRLLRLVGSLRCESRPSKFKIVTM